MALRIRLTFSKAGAMQYVGHLDLHRAWERSFRRSGLPLAYSQGFHPQPRLNLACALPLGFTSECEVLDAWLEQELPLSEIQEAFSSSLPPGINIRSLEKVDLCAPVLQAQVRSAVYIITFLDEVPDLEKRISRIANAEHLPRIRRNKPYDLRPLIEELSLIAPKGDGMPSLNIQMAARDGATGRPEELLEEMGINFETTQVHRKKLIFIIE